jgi:glycosyltransferase involved in cell wall biosynthesis/2-polyprenyl-3-methyl-5-hydroxy-6-metoxy-1,4-benzoquinol methylase
MRAITIVAQNYLPFAAVLAESFREHNPGAEFVTLVVDGDPGGLADDELSSYITPCDLSLAPDEFGRMALLYDVTELSTSLKPWALEYVLDCGEDVAIYLDPDIYVYSTLREVAALSRTHGVVLTPHTTSPMPRDGKRPNEADIMAAGVYNLGFIAVDASSRPMLDWWKQRLLRDSLSDQTNMLFTDQRWIDLAPGYFPHHILLDPGYNVAYWNLDQRDLTVDADRNVSVNGRPLRFFHFSGYRPEKPWLLSKHCPQDARVVLSEYPLLRELCDEYGERLVKAGMEAAAATPYRFNELFDHVAVTPAIRRVYRAEVLEADRRGGVDYPPPAFGIGSNESFVAWLTGPAEAGSRVSRVLYGIWKMRPDLQAVYPNPLGSDEYGFLLWGANSAVSEGWLPPELAPNELEVTLEHPAEIPVRDEPGVNLAGYFQAELGVGQIGRLLVDAVRESGLPYSTWRSTKTVNRQLAGYDDATEQVLYPVTIASINADQFPSWNHEGGRLIREGRYTIGVWAWEVEEFPDAYDGALELVDEVWAISTFCRDAIAAKTTKPVRVIPYQILPPTVNDEFDLHTYGLADVDYFLFSFDHMSVFDRKNPLDLVAAFCAAFEPGEGPKLVIKSINGERCLSDRERLRLACAQRDDIVLIEDYLHAADVAALMKGAVAYVSLHRAEGYGLTMAEAMALGKPVIATGYGGNVDFMNDENSLLVGHTTVGIGDNPPYPATARWAQPDLDDAATKLRWIIAEPAAAVELGARAQLDVLSSSNLARASSFIVDRVSHAFRARASRLADAPRDPGQILDDVRRQIAAPPELSTPSRYPSIAPHVRQAVYRALAHHDEQWALRLNSVVDALAEIERDTRARVETVEASRREAEAARRRAETKQRHMIESAARAAERAGTRQDVTERRLAELVQRIDEFAAVGRADGARLDEIVTRLNSLAAHTARLDSELVARPYQMDPDALLIVGDDGRPVLGYEHGGSHAAGRTFADVFRGSPDLLIERLRPYLPVLGEGPVLDIGCGRGELLQLLAAEGVPARGVEIDRALVDQCRRAGLDVDETDGLSALRQLDAGSLGAVVAVEVIEHLSTDDLRTLVFEARRVLRPGGTLLLETVNPHSPPALKAFWLDITHVRPLYPESMLFLAQDAGFASARIMFLDPERDLAANLRDSGEYALVATAT